MCILCLPIGHKQKNEKSAPINETGASQNNIADAKNINKKSNGKYNYSCTYQNFYLLCSLSISGSVKSTTNSLKKGIKMEAAGEPPPLCNFYYLNNSPYNNHIHEEYHVNVSAKHCFLFLLSILEYTFSVP